MTLARLFAKHARFLHCQQGSAFVLWAVVLPAVVGMMGLGLETGMWYLGKRNLQATADAAAIAGAYESDTSDRTSAATSAVSSNGFGAGSNVTATVNNPPLSGSYTSNSKAVEVILSQPQNLMFSGVFLSSRPTITVRAVAVRQTAGDACVLALNSVSSDTVGTQGNAILNMPDCMVAANSNDSSAIEVLGSSQMIVQGLYTPGGYSTSCNSSTCLQTTTTPITGGVPLTDPYASLSVPSYSGCNQTSYTVNNHSSTTTLSPGVYCNGLDVKTAATMQPGTYIVNGGSFSVEAQASLSGSGVTIILTGSGSNYATTTINGGATVNISAPTSGTYSGITFFQDRNATVDNSNKFNGGSTMNITGVMYFPKGDISFNGGNSQNSPCTQIVGYKVVFSGNSDTNIGTNCTNTGVSSITLPGLVKLEE